MCKIKEETLPDVQHLMMFDVDEFLIEDDDDEFSDDNDDDDGNDYDLSGFSDELNWWWLANGNTDDTYNDSDVPTANATESTWTSTTTTITTTTATTSNTSIDIEDSISLTAEDSSLDSNRTEYLAFAADYECSVRPETTDAEDWSGDRLTGEDSSMSVGFSTGSSGSISSSDATIVSERTSNSSTTNKTNTNTTADASLWLSEDSDSLHVYNTDATEYYLYTDGTNTAANNYFGIEPINTALNDDDLQMEDSESGTTTISLDISYAQCLSGITCSHTDETMSTWTIWSSDSTSDTENSLQTANSTTDIQQSVSLAFADYDTEILAKMMNADTIAVITADNLTELSSYDVRWHDPHTYAIMQAENDDDVADADMWDIYGP